MSETIIHSNGDFDVRKSGGNYEVCMNKFTHAIRLAVYGPAGDVWLARAIQKCDELANKAKAEQVRR